MSGGSYNYLFCKDAEQLWEHQNDLRQMAERLGGIPWAKDAARETEELLLILQQTWTRLQVRKDRLSGIFRAVEWWDSSDSGPGYLAHELAKYREDTATLAKYPPERVSGQDRPELCMTWSSSDGQRGEYCDYRKGHDGEHAWAEWPRG